MKYLGAAIRRRREKLGLKVGDLAHQADLGEPSNLSRLENGTQWPKSPDKLKNIARVLGCSVSDLFAEAELSESAANKEPLEVREREATYKVSLDPEDSGNLGDLRFALDLHQMVLQIHTAHSRAIQTVFAALAKQLDASKLLYDIRSAKQLVEIEDPKNKLLEELLDHLIAQLMRSAKNQ